MPANVIDNLQQYAQIVSPLITAMTLIFVIFNVNRSQKKSRQNDEEKFKRDLNLKASDEMIEAISSLRHSCGYYFSLNHLRDEINNEASLTEFIYHINGCIKLIDEALMILQTRFYQRKIILDQYDSDVESVYVLGCLISSSLCDIKKWYTIDVGHTDQEIMDKEEKLLGYVYETVDQLNAMQTNIQNQFLGKLYEKQ
ncbi:hypothetical protein [Paenibacillus tianjinensis]|uniref:DUF4760 domain-containing protein n=1 Tax=Paenibacillus tianjinensis TaxID=2810347 RepID=A0ABX7L9B1_9BACL|nr:hypothetical protein [Paenibacillus tianjinensis]QSF43303.1 hypothetical protein JRJ22_18725 [Paenibacillus tianjinensis]